MMMEDVRIVDSKRFIQGETGPWEVIIGMEVHAQVLSKSKLFSGASTAFGAEPNQNVALFDAAMPGTLPVLNEECVRQAVLTGLGLKAVINHKSVFDRKNYFYPDLPHGYQISQYYYPIVGEGKILVSLGPDSSGLFEDIEIRIDRLHLEQDAGKSLHDHHPAASCIDLNRSGVALMEIVSKPDLRSSQEAKAYLTKLRALLRYLNVCDGNMDQGSLRADVNVSVRRPGEAFGTRCEIKNLNSIRFIGQAIEYEARRQISLLEEGKEVCQETLLFNESAGKTYSMRSKEEAYDYRFFPDPDLLPLEIDTAYINALLKDLPELPDDKKDRFVQKMGLSAYDASILVSDKGLADYFESLSFGRDPKLAANWVINELMGYMNKYNQDIENTSISPHQLGVILDLLSKKTISNKIAKELFEIIWTEGGDPLTIVETRGMNQITDIDLISRIVDEVIANNPEKAKEALLKPAMAGWFVGHVMKAMEGKANPRAVNEMVCLKLGLDQQKS